MYPHERSLAKRFEGRPLSIIGVNSDRDPATVARALKENGLIRRSFFDGGGTGGPVATKWQVKAWPTVYVIDQHGVIRARQLRDRGLENEIEKLLAEIK